MNDQFAFCDGRCGVQTMHPRYECPQKHVWEVVDDDHYGSDWVQTTCNICLLYHNHIFDHLSRCVECPICNKRTYVQHLSILTKQTDHLLAFYEEKHAQNERLHLTLLIKCGFKLIYDYCLTLEEFETASRGTFSHCRAMFKSAYVQYHARNSKFYGRGRIYHFKNHYVTEQMINEQLALIQDSCEWLELNEQKKMFMEDMKGNCRTEDSNDSIYHLNCLHRNNKMSLKDMALIGTRIWRHRQWKIINIPLLPDVPPPAPKRTFSNIEKDGHEN